MTKIRVVLLLHELSLTGAPRVALDLFGALTDAVDLHIISPKPGPMEQKARELGTVTIVNQDWSVKTLTARVQRRLFRSRVEQTVKQWKPDIIYVNSVASLSVLNWCQWPDVPVVLHVHELEAVIEFYAHGLETSMRERPVRYIATSKAVKQMLAANFGIEDGKIAVVYPCVGTTLEQLPVPEKRAGDTRFVVGSCGTPEPRKGPVLWLQMAAALAARVGTDKVRFVWVGLNASYESTLFRMTARKLALESCVEFVPLTPDPWKYFAEFDVFTVTSWEEAFSIVMAETMMMGKPGLCFSGCGGTPEVIGDTGIAIPGFSPDAMAAAIAELMHAPQRLAELGQKARQRVIDNFLPAGQAHKIEQELRSVLNQQSIQS